MNKFQNIELTNWQRSAGGWFKYNVGFTENPVFSICIYHDKREVYSEPYHKPDAATRPMYNDKDTHFWVPVFGQTIYYLNEVFHKTYGEEFIGTEVEAKKFIDQFMIRMSDLLVFS